ncbi:MAG: hypothetical protein ABL984_08760 [Pyrinomonadaceae bacterium]
MNVGPHRSTAGAVAEGRVGTVSYVPEWSGVGSWSETAAARAGTGRRKAVGGSLTMPDA